MSAQSYLAALRAIGLREVTGVDASGYYQGDYFAAVTGEEYSYDDTERIGLLVIGYGSCSGCDAWEAADTPKERLKVLADQIEAVKWFDDLDAFKGFLAGDGAKLEWYGHEEEWAEFVAKVNALEEYTNLEPAK